MSERLSSARFWAIWLLGALIAGGYFIGQLATW